MILMKLWVIEVTEYWDERDDQPKGPPHVLGGRVWLSRGACQHCADGWNLASDHNSYQAVPIKLVVFDRIWLRYGLPRKAAFHLHNLWFWVKVRLPLPVRKLLLRQVMSRKST